MKTGNLVNHLSVVFLRPMLSVRDFLNVTINPVSASMATASPMLFTAMKQAKCIHESAQAVIYIRVSTAVIFHIQREIVLLRLQSLSRVSRLEKRGR